MIEEARADVVVIGAGAVGLACAAAIARRWSVIVVEREPRPGLALSGRNSGVLHAGIHHPREWLKTTLCVRGRELLTERATRLGIAHRRCGKLVLAIGDRDREALARIADRARENGIEARAITGREARALEPRVRCDEALVVDATAVIDARALVASLEGEARALGARIELGMEVRAIERGWIVETDRLRVSAPVVVIAAGLDADRIARLAGLAVPAHRACAGRWMRLDARWDRAISRLVYPVPSEGGLGIHLTIDLDGRVRAGPDAVWIDAREAPEIDPPARTAFAAALVRYLPGISEQDLAPDARAVRPRLHGPGGSADFVIEREGDAVVLLGIESPGLTACLAIAERVEALVAG